MTVLFGSIEYFEKEIVQHMSNDPYRHLSASKQLEASYEWIKDELANVFICSETTKKDLLENLSKAYEKVSVSMETLTKT
ncbi:hypothetical protein [Robertmurraya massiliosenegalensis]|uniref:hypothetical protein n=1 Tax=Robertmurraya massiliosenegalensis TaxID=1287657 RepID=UPI000309857D|nr:hypothetical protein [Robertmurraya massiliosenegalensis]